MTDPMIDQDPEIGAADPADPAAPVAAEEAAAEQEFDHASPRKKGLGRGALMFLVMMVAAGTLYFLFMRPTPKAAKGATSKVAAAQVTITEFLNDGPRNVDRMRRTLADTGKLVTQFMSYPNAQQVPLVQLKSNPFSYTPGADVVARRASSDDDRQAALKAVQTLQLQTIISSEQSRSCLINNKLYMEGQTVDIFTIEKIRPDAVIVRSGSYRFELQIQR